MGDDFVIDLNTTIQFGESSDMASNEIGDDKCDEEIGDDDNPPFEDLC